MLYEPLNFTAYPLRTTDQVHVDTHVDLALYVTYPIYSFDKVLQITFVAHKLFDQTGVHIPLCGMCYELLG